MTKTNTKKENIARPDRDAAFRQVRDNQAFDFIEAFAFLKRHRELRHVTRNSPVPVLMFYDTIEIEWDDLLPLNKIPSLSKPPQWRDTSYKAKVQSILLGMAEKRCLSFTALLHSEYERRWLVNEKNVVRIVAKALRRHLVRNGFGHLHYFFFIEGFSGSGEVVDLHIHGVVQARTVQEWDAFYNAVSSATGNFDGRREHNAVSIVGHYGFDGWQKYISKNAHRPDGRILSRREHYPQHTRRMGKALYDRLAFGIGLPANDNRPISDRPPIVISTYFRERQAVAKVCRGTAQAQ